MTDADVFGKLSRIFETHAFSNDDAALNDFLEDFDPNNMDGGYDSRGSPTKTKMYVIWRAYIIVNPCNLLISFSFQDNNWDSDR